MDIIRAWKDEEYRLTLTEEQRALLPDNPAGPMELSDDELDSIVGGQESMNVLIGCSIVCRSAVCNSAILGNCPD
jgi:mersacidin/lichenicidin family type 2 lantibiotic